MLASAKIRKLALALPNFGNIWQIWWIPCKIFSVKFYHSCIKLKIQASFCICWTCICTNVNFIFRNLQSLNLLNLHALNLNTLNLHSLNLQALNLHTLNLWGLNLCLLNMQVSCQCLIEIEIHGSRAMHSAHATIEFQPVNLMMITSRHLQ